VNAVLTAHGDMVATLSKSGASDYALSNQRSFDAWGNVRIGSTSGNPTGRYCANIGHRQDDESGLVYMRARYYEPTSGRFVSQDRNMDGINWFTYSNNDPVNLIDRGGNSAESERLALIGSILIVVGWVFMVVGAGLAIYSTACYMIKLVDDFTKLGPMLHPQGGGLENMRILAELMYYGIEQPGQPRNLAIGSLGGALLALGGYLMMVEGYQLMTEADMMDPSSGNAGIFEGLF